MTILDVRSVIRIAMAASLIGFASAANATDAAADPEAAARENWRAYMSHNPEQTEGCFEATYPEYVWRKAGCKVVQPRVHPVLRVPTKGAADVTGNGHDYAVLAQGLISETLGSFPTVTGVKSEKGVGVPLFGGGGILGPNEYSLQLNTNLNGTTSVCAGHSGCTVWQQFIYAPDYVRKGQGSVFMQYWLIGWGSSRCPRTFGSDGGSSCYKNSAIIAAPDMPISALKNLQILGVAVGGGKDTVEFSNGTKIYSVSGPDSVLDISSVWRESEFNIVGNAGGSRANFNKGSSLVVNVALNDGSNLAPICVANAGSTGETNNLNLHGCATAGGSIPQMEFLESN